MKMLFVASAFHRAEAFASVCKSLERLGCELTYYPIYMRLFQLSEELKKGNPKMTEKELGTQAHLSMFKELAILAKEHESIFFWKAENVDPKIIGGISRIARTIYYSWDDPFQIEVDPGAILRGALCHVTATCCEKSAGMYQQAGARKAIWLPPGYDPEVHFEAGTPTADVCFVATNTYCKQAYGKVENPPFDRRDIIHAVQKVTDLIELWGRGDEPLGWFHPTCGDPSFKKYYKGFIQFDKAREAFSRAKICLNSHVRRCGYKYFNERTFQILGCKRVELIDNNPGTLDVLGNSVVAYNTVDEIPSIIERLLKNDGERLALAEKGYELSKEYTWDRFAERIVEELNGINI
jgi:glycosyltransferase involved in cell wall biosynthesis